MGKHVTRAKHGKNLTTVTRVSVKIYHLLITDKVTNAREAMLRNCDYRQSYRSKCVLVSLIR